MDGLEMCRKLRKNIATATTPIILLTAKESIEIEKESARLNIDSFIAKPFDPDILKLKVESIIAKSKKIEEKMRLETLASPKMVDITSANEKFLSDITAIIEENISNSDFNVNELSRLSDYSVKQLYRKIKQLTGYSPVDYIKSIRMKKAAMLLSQKKFTIAEVMYMVGFSSHSYFSKCFQVFFDMTPRQFLDKNNT
jgi:AraC-like DNA-binding protein